MYFVRVPEIDWIETASNYVRLHVGKVEHLMRESLANLETRLDPARFLRMHRTTIVKVERLRELQPWFSWEFVAILQDGTRLKVSRGYRDRVAKWLGGVNPWPALRFGGPAHAGDYMGRMVTKRRASSKTS